MLIRQVIPLTAISPWGIVFYWVIPLSLDVARNSLLLPTIVLKVRIVSLLTQSLSYSGYVGSYRIYVFLKHIALLYSTTIRVRFRLHVMMYFTNTLNTLATILCATISCRELSVFVLLIASACQMSDVFTKAHSPGCFYGLVSKPINIYVSTLSLRGIL